MQFTQVQNDMKDIIKLIH